MILMLEILTSEDAWNISENALLMISSLAIGFLKCKKSIGHCSVKAKQINKPLQS